MPGHANAITAKLLRSGRERALPTSAGPKSPSPVRSPMLARCQTSEAFSPQV